MASIAPLCDRLSAIDGKVPAEAWEGILRSLILGSLWGNRVDLSLWPHEEGATYPIEENRSAFLLCNHLDAVSEFLRSSQQFNIGIVTDNQGMELLCDLSLADGLLALGIAAVVTLHVKGHPTFVSDGAERVVSGSVSHTLSSDYSRRPVCHGDVCGV